MEHGIVHLQFNLKINELLRKYILAEIDNGSQREKSSNIRPYVLVLLILFGLFAFRVIAQLLQFIYPVSFLPSYEAWHSGALPYAVLLMTQGIILAMCLRIAWGVFKGTIVASRQKGKILLGVGFIYFVSMGARLMIGLTIASDHYWFGAVLPTFFHMVLASFLIVYGRFHAVVSRAYAEGEKVDLG